MRSPSSFLVRTLATLIIVGHFHSAMGQAQLGNLSFDFGVTQDLGPSIDIFSGALTVTGRYAIGAGTAPYDPNATWKSGHVSYTHDVNPLVGGLGVYSLTTTGGVAAINAPGTGAEELVFSFNGGTAQAGSVSMVINGLAFGSNPYNAGGYNLQLDDPMLWMNTDMGQLIFSEQQIRAATTLASGSGTLDFAKLAGLPVDARTDRFALRETSGAINIKQINVGDYQTVPEPGATCLVGVTGIVLLLRRRSRA